MSYRELAFIGVDEDELKKHLYIIDMVIYCDFWQHFDRFDYGDLRYGGYYGLCHALGKRSFLNGNFKSYAYTSIKNSIKDYIQKTLNMYRGPYGYFFTAYNENGLSGEDDHDNLVINDLIINAGLSSAEKKVVAWYYRDGYDIKEIMRFLGCSDQTVRNHIRSGLRKMQEKSQVKIGGHDINGKKKVSNKPKNIDEKKKVTAIIKIIKKEENILNLSRKIGCSHATLRKWIREYDPDFKGGRYNVAEYWEAKRKLNQKRDEEIAKLRNEGYSLNELGRKFRMWQSRIRIIIKQQHEKSQIS